MPLVVGCTSSSPPLEEQPSGPALRCSSQPAMAVSATLNTTHAPREDSTELPVACFVEHNVSAVFEADPAVAPDADTGAACGASGGATSVRDDATAPALLSGGNTPESLEAASAERSPARGSKSPLYDDLGLPWWTALMVAAVAVTLLVMGMISTGLFD